MHIEINDHTTLRHIQKVFADFYPHLQIEFHNKPHKRYEASSEFDFIFPANVLTIILPAKIDNQKIDTTRLAWFISNNLIFLRKVADQVENIVSGMT